LAKIYFSKLISPALEKKVLFEKQKNVFEYFVTLLQIVKKRILLETKKLVFIVFSFFSCFRYLHMFTLPKFLMSYVCMYVCMAWIKSFSITTWDICKCPRIQIALKISCPTSVNMSVLIAQGIWWYISKPRLIYLHSICSRYICSYFKGTKNLFKIIFASICFSQIHTVTMN
jgi:hypothetical protein